MICPNCHFKGCELESFGYTENGLFEWVRCEACNTRYTKIYKCEDIQTGWVKPENAVDVDV